MCVGGRITGLRATLVNLCRSAESDRSPQMEPGCLLPQDCRLLQTASVQDLKNICLKPNSWGSGIKTPIFPEITQMEQIQDPEVLSRADLEGSQCIIQKEMPDSSGPEQAGGGSRGL